MKWLREFDAQITDLRIHDLRRSFATFAAKAGASLPDVAAR